MGERRDQHGEAEYDDERGAQPTDTTLKVSLAFRMTFQSSNKGDPVCNAPMPP